MKPLAFEDLARLPVTQFYQAAFRKATGVAVKIVPPEGELQGHTCGPAENPFCGVMASAPASCAACYEIEACVQRKVAQRGFKQQIHCYAGLTLIAAPVRIGGRHVATLLSGQVFRREPTERDFQMIMRQFGDHSSPDWVRKAHKTYFETPVLTAERFQAATQLLDVFAQYLADAAGRQAVASSESEPKVVGAAKRFVLAHAEEAITLDQVVSQVHVSRFYFCKLFKRATGMTLTEYIARVRIEKAKELLGDPSRRISEVVFASGFGSIPHFNSVFKQHVGMAPTDYRASLRGALAV
jgi:AraC-like DNA-binding protein/ligand-binding sensor protein